MCDRRVSLGFAGLMAGKKMGKNWKRQRITGEMLTYYKLICRNNSYSVCIFERYKSGEAFLKIGRDVTQSRENAQKILILLIKHKVTICTFYDVIYDLLIC